MLLKTKKKLLGLGVLSAVAVTGLTVALPLVINNKQNTTAKDTTKKATPSKKVKATTE